jgi:hypothetical protein
MYDLIPFEEYLSKRRSGDCPAIDARCDYLIEDFRREKKPDVVLMELRSMWSGENELALLLEIEPQRPMECLIRRVITRVM